MLAYIETMDLSYSKYINGHRADKIRKEFPHLFKENGLY